MTTYTYNPNATAFVYGAEYTEFIESVQTVNNSATLVDLPNFSCQLNPNDRVAFRAVLHVLSTTDGTPGLTLRADCPASPTLYRVRSESFFDAAATTYQTSLADIDITWTTATAGVVVLEGLIQNGSNDGELQLQFAQETGTAVDTSIYAGSSFTYRKF